jgi:pimeloyl-ACP methyl ester carboxylesterase
MAAPFYLSSLQRALPLVLLLSFLLDYTTAFSQPTTPADWGLKSFSLHDKQLGTIRFYIDTVNINAKAPLLLHINGSGGAPLCIFAEGQSKAVVLTTFDTQLLRQAAADYHFVVLDKPGTPFCEQMQVKGDDFSHVLEDYSPSAEYTQQLSLEWRITATRKVISYLIRQGFYDKSKIVVWGYSEGGQVVPPLALQDKRITHAVSVVGAGLNQLYDDIVQWRIDAATGKLSHQQAQDSIDQRLRTIKEIYAHPHATNKTFAGHTYKRWASFTLDVPFESLRQLQIPIYMLVATKDPNSPVYGLDYVPLEFIRLGKNNLTYEVCLGCDHYLNLQVAKEEGTELQQLGGAYNQKILDWLTR